VLENPPNWTPRKPELTSDEDEFRNMKFALVNCTPVTTNDIKLFQWEKEPQQDTSVPDSYRREPAKTRAYQLETNAGSRYFAGLNGVNIDDTNFNNRIEVEVKYFSGKQKKPEPGTASSFEDNNSDEFTGNIYRKAEIPEEVTNINPNLSNYITINIDNKNLKPGFYQLQYKIVQDAKVPGWVTAKSVANREEFLRKLDSEGQVKVIGFDIVYNGIAREYNHIDTRKICSEELYLVKY
jgi:hypothetical protein